MLKSSEWTVEKYTVKGTVDGYIIHCGGVLVHWQKPATQGRLKGTGGYDAFTNAQRGVMWLKNENMVREQAVAVKVGGVIVT
jgi:hypothetical protein